MKTETKMRRKMTKKIMKMRMTRVEPPMRISSRSSKN
jgi:hypothetical protein